MDNQKEFYVLFQIARGVNTKETIAAIYALTDDETQLVIEELSQKGLLETKNSLGLSSRGLLELSKWIAARQSEHEYIYSSVDNRPYFQYKSSLTKDTIFFPDLIFRPANPYFNDEQEVVYVTSLPSVNFSLENLLIMENLLFEQEILHPTGFWLLKCKTKKLCGWGANNLEKTLQKVENPVCLVFLYAFSEFIIIATSDAYEGIFRSLQLKIYLTKVTFPYVDTIEYIDDMLKPFLYFNGVKEILRGKELQLKKSDYWQSFQESRTGGSPFKLKVYGSILYKDKAHNWGPNPFVVIMKPSDDAGTCLERISPWFVTFPGGVNEQELEESYHISSFDVISLPSIDILSLMMRPS